jgi:hypothetical protein
METDIMDLSDNTTLYAASATTESKSSLEPTTPHDPTTSHDPDSVEALATRCEEVAQKALKMAGAIASLRDSGINQMEEKERCSLDKDVQAYLDILGGLVQENREVFGRIKSLSSSYRAVIYGPCTPYVIYRVTVRGQTLMLHLLKPNL